MMHMTEINSGLTKEILSKNRECQGMHLFESTVGNSLLMDQLSQLAIENQQLKLQLLAIQEENAELHSQLTFSSRRWTNGAYKRWLQGQEETGHQADSPEGSAESWQEVSQKLINQMQQEMKEMEDLGQRLAAENASVGACAYCESGSGELVGKLTNEEMTATVSDEDLERAKTTIQCLKGQSEHLKGQLATQRTVLQSSLNQLKKVVKAGAVILTEKSGTAALNSEASKSKLDRPSDELFRAYFTQQLHNSSGGPQQCQRSTDSEEKGTSEVTKEIFEQKSETGREQSPEEKICPVCEASFPYETPLDDFQNHVLDHFENEHSTLMQQYEIL